MSSLVCAVVGYVVNAAWEVPLIASAAWAVSGLLKKISPRTQHVTWAAALVAAVLTPVLPMLVLPGFQNAAASHASSVIAPVVGAATSAKGMIVLPANVILLLFSGYICAFFYFAARLVFSFFRTLLLVRDSSLAALNQEQSRLWNHCSRAFSLADASIRTSPDVHGPVTAGFLRSVLLLPAGFSEQCTMHDFLTAIGHECSHMKRRDFEKNFLYEVVSLAIAFHPVTWLLKSQIAQTREMVCDAMVVEKLMDSYEYTQSLLRLAAMIAHLPQAFTTHAIGIFDAHILEKRIMRITAKKLNLTLAMKCGLIAPGVLLLSSVVAASATAAVGIEPQAQPSSSSSASQADLAGQIYHIGSDVSAPRVIYAPDPVFPKSAHKGKGTFQGMCVVKAVVTTSGTATDVQVVRSLGPDFDASAIKAVQQYRFSPAMHAGMAVPVLIRIEVNFRRY